MSQPPSSANGTTRGATSVGAERPRRRRPLWLLLAALVVALVVLALLLSRCGGDDSTGASGAASTSGGSTGQTGSGASSGSTVTAGSTGSIVTSGGSTLLAAGQSAGDLPAALTAATGQPVTGSAVQVLSVPADEGFWVGSDESSRVWVQLTGSGESSYQVHKGDRVNFTGTVVAHDGSFAAQAGVDAAEGADQLTTQAQHIAVAKTALTGV